MPTNLTPELKAKFEAIIKANFVGDANFTIGHVLFLMLQAHELDRWVDVKDEKPPVCKEVLCEYNTGVMLRYFSKGHEVLSVEEWINNIKVSNWMHKPLPPNPPTK